MSMVKLCYIAGPYRAGTINAVRENIRAAERAAIAAVRLGFYPVSPHACTAFFDGLAPDKLWLEGGLELLRRCDAIMLCPGFRDSEGTMAEQAEARAQNKPAYLHHDTHTSEIGRVFDGDPVKGPFCVQTTVGTDCPVCGVRGPGDEMKVTDEGVSCPQHGAQGYAEVDQPQGKYDT